MHSLALQSQKSAVYKHMLFQAGSASIFSTHKNVPKFSHPIHNIHKHAACDFCLRAERTIYFARSPHISGLVPLPQTALDPPGPRALIILQFYLGAHPPLKAS